jgi:hypothetical protein
MEQTPTRHIHATFALRYTANASIEVTSQNQVEETKTKKSKALTITKERLESSLPPPTKAPFLVVKRLNDLQVLRFQSHDGAATENHYFKRRRASDLVALLAALQHTVLTERLQTVFEHLPANDAFPLWKRFRGLRARGLFERCA